MKAEIGVKMFENGLSGCVKPPRKWLPTVCAWAGSDTCGPPNGKPNKFIGVA